MNGNRLKFLLASFLFLVLINVADAQRLKVNKIKKRFDAGEWQEMQLELNEYKEDRGEDALVLFFQTKIDVRSIQDKNGLRLAVFKLQKAVDTYALLDAKDAEHYCEKQILCIDFISEFKLQTTLQLWSKIKEDRALNEIEDFINTFPNLNEIHEMIAFRDEVAFQNIEHSKDRKAFENYIQSYPASAFVDKAKKIIEQLAFDEASGLYTIKALEGFIAEFPMSPMVSEAKALILKIEWEQVSVSDDYDALTQFYQLYASSVYGPECKKLLVAIEWRKMKTVENIRELEKWQKQNGEFPEGQQALEKLKVMKDFALPYLNKSNKYNLYCEWDGKVDRTVEFDDFVMVPNGDFVIKKDGKYGVLDKRGKTKLQPVYHQIEVGKGEYLIRINRNYQIYRADGTFLNLPYKHVEQSDWNGDLLMVTDYVNGQAKAGVINWKGKILVPLKYEMIDEFLGTGLIGWVDNDELNPDMSFGDLYNFYGKFLRTAKRFGSVEDDLIEYCVANLEEGNTEICGLMDTSGKDIFVPEYSSIYSTDEKGVFKVGYTESSSFVDRSGKTLLEPVHSNYYLEWLGNGLYVSRFNDNMSISIDENNYVPRAETYVLDARTGNRFIEHPVKDAFVLWPNKMYFIVRGDDYLEVFEIATRKSISKMSFREYDSPCEMIYPENYNEGYYKDDLSMNLESSPYLPWCHSGYSVEMKTMPFNYLNLGGNLLLIDNLTGKIHATYPQSCHSATLGKFNFINRNEKNVIVDENNKELNVKGDIDFAGPISDSKFFYVVSNNGNKETFIYDTEKNKNVMQFPGECYGTDAYPHFYRIGATPQFFIFEDGQLLKD